MAEPVAIDRVTPACRRELSRVRALRVSTLAIVLSATILPIAGQDSPIQTKESLWLSCPTQVFLQVSVSTPEHNALPNVDLTLFDPNSRIAGRGTGEAPIPSSHYGQVIEIPSAPEKSLSLAVEVCNALRGDYRIKIDERGNEPYRLSIRGSAKKTSQTLVLHHTSKDGRTLQFVFRFRVAHGRAVVGWVDGEGGEIPASIPIELNDW